MAKAKKSETDPKKKISSSKEAQKSKSAAPRVAGAAPMVDTGLAASAAAKMLFANKKSDAANPAKKGGLINQLKADLNRHSSTSVSGMLDKSAPPGSKKPHLPFGGKQVAHNQTFGGDITRSGVPRRTPG